MKNNFFSITNLLLFLASCTFFSCKEEVVEYQPNICKQMPRFVQQMGFPPGNSFFSTTDTRKMGLVLKQSAQVNNPNAGIVKEYQHPSWRSAGWLAPILLDEQGNIYTAPAPFVNILNNPNNKNNSIFKVDNQTGILEEWLQLPQQDSTIQNPFGIIGMVYLCEAQVLYASSVSGSDRQNERGCIYAVDVKTKKIIDKITGTDATGMGISYTEGKRKLYFGTGRSSDIYAVILNKDGKFGSVPTVSFSIAGLGERGDDKVRRIFNNKDGTLTVAGFEFNYNLIAPREKQETQYQFSYDEEAAKWIFIK